MAFITFMPKVYMKLSSSTLRRYSLYAGFALLLVVLSFSVYAAQILLFHDARTTEFYLLQDVAFLPLQVLLGVLIVDRIISRREKGKLMSKLNMVIGVFFGECGNGLLSRFSAVTKGTVPLCSSIGTSRWTKKDYAEAAAAVRNFSYDIEVDEKILEDLWDFLRTKREGLLRLLENPNLLEHEHFTDLLWAVTHLAEECEHRGSFAGLPPADLEHLRGDILRAYRLLVLEWLSYMKHLQESYPYLFSLAVRKNPFMEKRAEK